MYCNYVFKLLGIFTRPVKQLYSAYCLIGHTFKGVQWCNVNNVNMISRKNIKNLSLTYPNISVGSSYEAIGKRHVQNPANYLRRSILQILLAASTRQLFSQKVPPQTCGRVLNSSLIVYKYYNCKGFIESLRVTVYCIICGQWIH